MSYRYITFQFRSSFTKMGHGECRYYTIKEKVIKNENGHTQTITIPEKCDCPGFVQEHFGSKNKHPCLWCDHDFRSHKT